MSSVDEELDIRTAPWASPDARARLASVEKALPPNGAEALQQAATAAAAHGAPQQFLVAPLPLQLGVPPQRLWNKG